MKPGTLLIDSSTIAPDEARGVATCSKEKSAEFIDAPVSGGMYVWRYVCLKYVCLEVCAYAGL